LNVHLGLLALGRSGKSDHAEYPRAHPGGNRLDRAALAGAIATFKHDADLLGLVPYPFLKVDQLHMQLAQPALVVLALEAGLFAWLAAVAGWCIVANPPPFAVFLVLGHVQVTSSAFTSAQTIQPLARKEVRKTS
jgi:hypothetical protein